MISNTYIDILVFGNSMLKNKHNFEKGMTLIEVMVAMSLLGVMGLGIMKLTQDSNRSVNKIKSDVGLEDQFNTFKIRLSNPDACNAFFNDLTPGGDDVSADRNDITELFLHRRNPMTLAWDVDAAPLFREGDFIPGTSIRLDDIIVRQFAPTAGTEGTCRIDFMFSRNSTAGTGAATFSKQVDFFCRVDDAAAPNVDNCSPESAGGEQLWQAVEVGGLTHVNNRPIGAQRFVVIGDPAGVTPTVPLEVIGRIKSLSMEITNTSAPPDAQLCLNNTCITAWNSVVRDLSTCTDLPVTANDINYHCPGDQALMGIRVTDTTPTFSGGEMRWVTPRAIFLRCCAKRHRGP